VGTLTDAQYAYICDYDATKPNIKFLTSKEVIDYGKPSNFIYKIIIKYGNHECFATKAEIQLFYRMRNPHLKEKELSNFDKAFVYVKKEMKKEKNDRTLGFKATRLYGNYLRIRLNKIITYDYDLILMSKSVFKQELLEKTIFRNNKPSVVSNIIYTMFNDIPEEYFRYIDLHPLCGDNEIKYLKRYKESFFLLV